MRARGLADSMSDIDSNLMNPPKKLRSTSDTFQWDSTCFFCCKEAVLDVRRPKINANIHFARTLSLRDNVLDMCNQRLDSWALEVMVRLQLCIDLPAADAVYHGTCYTKFSTGRNHPDAAPSPISQTDDKMKMKSFVEMCEWFEGSDDLCSVVEMRKYL